MRLPLIHFSTDHSVSELVQFVSALRDALRVFSLRIACDDQLPEVWVRGWEKGLERYVLRAVRSS